MKRHLLALMALAFVACSPPPSNEDAQLQVERGGETPEPPPTWQLQAFDPDAKVVHPHRLADIIDHLEEVGDLLQKDEYETTKEYEARMAQADEEFEPVALNTPYLISNGGGRRNYRPRYLADEEVFKNYPIPYCTLLDISKGIVDCPMDEETKRRSTYQGVNAFGVEAEVMKTMSHRYFIQINHGRNADLTQITKFPEVVCPIPRDKAKELGDDIRWGAVIELTSWTVHQRGEEEKAATIHSPSERVFKEVSIHPKITHVVCFDGKSGEVLHSQSL